MYLLELNYEEDIIDDGGFATVEPTVIRTTSWMSGSHPESKPSKQCAETEYV